MLSIGLALLPSAAFTQETNCRAITDSLERLRCYDAQPAPKHPATPLAPKPAAPSEDPLIFKAKAAIKKHLREPDSARFDLKVKTAADGKKGVCGTVNARNANGGMTGPKLVVFDGQYAHILVSNEGPDNPTSFDRILLGVMLGDSLKSHDKFCK